LAMTKNELIEALRAVASSEFEQIPKADAEIDYSFSTAFMRRMERLFRNQKKAYWRFVNTVGKRVALVAATVLILFATACSIKPIREPIVRFFTEVYETFTSYFFESDAEETAIERKYRLDPAPEGFVEISRVEGNTLISTNYQSDDGVSIRITQGLSDGSNLKLDTEQSGAVTETVNGIEVILYQHPNVIQAVFIKDGYYFHISCLGNNEPSLIYEILEGLKA